MPLEFDEATHTYRLDGKIIPSVTQIIAPLYSFEHVNAEVLERASAFGTAVHRACELHDHDDLSDDLDDALLPYLKAWVKFRADADFWPTSIETRVHCPVYKFAGTLDRIGTISGKLKIIDIKTSTTLDKAIGVQLAGYEIAARSCGLIGPKEKVGRVAVQLREDGTYKIEPYNDDFDKSAFMALLTLKNWKEKNGN